MEEKKNRFKLEFAELQLFTFMRCGCSGEFRKPMEYLTSNRFSELR